MNNLGVLFTGYNTFSVDARSLRKISKMDDLLVNEMESGNGMK